MKKIFISLFISFFIAEFSYSENSDDSKYLKTVKKIENIIRDAQTKMNDLMIKCELDLKKKSYLEDTNSHQKNIDKYNNCISETETIKKTAKKRMFKIVSEFN